MNRLQFACLAGLALTGLAAFATAANASQAPTLQPPDTSRTLAVEVLADIRAQHADIFSDASFDEDNVVTIETTREIEASGELAAKLAAAGDYVRLEVVGGPTDQAKRDAIEAVASEFYSQPGVGPGITTYDELTERVVASYEPTGLADVIPGPSEVLGIPVVYEVSKVAPPRMA